MDLHLPISLVAQMPPATCQALLTDPQVTFGKGGRAAVRRREIVIETASTRGEQPKLHIIMQRLETGDTPAFYKPDRVAGYMKEPLVPFEDHLHTRGDQPAASVPPFDDPADHHRGQGAVQGRHDGHEMERELIRERTLDQLHATKPKAPAGRPALVDGDGPAVVRARQAKDETIRAIARHLEIGRSTLFRVFQPAKGHQTAPRWMS